MFKRVSLFILLNFLVILSISLIIRLLNLKPFLTSYGIDYVQLLAFCSIWGITGALISLLLSRKMAKWMMGVKLIDPLTSHPKLRELYVQVEELSLKAGLPCVPQVGIFESTAPNAFATGPSKRKALVAVSTSLLDQMTSHELKAIIGHEISHIANGDMITMTLIQGVVNAFVMFLARVLAFILSGLGRQSKESSSRGFGSYYLFVFLFEVLFMVLGSIVIAFFSRRREFRADRGGAKLTTTNSMISALLALQRIYEKQTLENQELPMASPSPAFQSLMIHRHRTNHFIKLFSTHPPIEERIEHLKASAYIGEWG